MQTLKQAIHLARSGKSRDLARAAYYLHGLPVGGWGETSQAMVRIREELPLRADRDYTVGDFVSAAYEVRGDRYYSRD